MSVVQQAEQSFICCLLSASVFKKISFLAGKLCIEVAPADKIAFISEELCIGCGICAKASCEQFVFL